MTEVVQTYNMFLNSDDAVNDGTNYDFQLGTNSITCTQGQYIRVTLNNYSQYVVWTGVNQYNNAFLLRNNLGAVNSAIFIDQQNYATISDIAANMASKFAIAIGAAFPAFGGVTVAAGTVASRFRNPGLK